MEFIVILEKFCIFKPTRGMIIEIILEIKRRKMKL